ncbi:MAG: GAF domain-containing protein, partial [Cyanobacteria bacterium P01_D01_bin.105]
MTSTLLPFTADDFQAQLARQLDYQKALRRILHKVRNSVELSRIFTTTSQDIARLLNAERVALYRFNNDWSGQFIKAYGYAVKPWDSIEAFGCDQVWDDTYLQETQGGRYKTNDSFAVADIYQAGHTQCHIEMLEQFQIRAYAIAPVFVGNQLWGLLAAYQHSAPRPWDKYETMFLAHAADYLGNALHHTNQQQQTKQKASELQALNTRQQSLSAVVRKVLASVDVDEILSMTCQEVTSLLNVDRIAIYRFNPDWSGQFVSTFSRLSLEPALKTPFGENNIWEDTHLKETQGGRYRKNETLAINDIYQANYAQCHLDLLEQYQVRAYALVPIFVGRTLWGLLGAYQHSAPYDWQQEEIDFLLQVTSHLSIALQSANTLNSSQIRAQTQTEAAEQRQILFDVVAKIRESLDLETIFKTTAKEVRRSLKADRVGIFQFNDGSQYCRGEFVAEDVRRGYDSALGTSLEDHCFGENYAQKYEKGRMQIIADIRKANFEECHTVFLEQFQIKGQMVMPLLKGSELWGLLCIHQCDAPHNWTDSDVNFVQQVADQLSVALLQASLHAQTQAQAEQLAKNMKALQTAQLKVIQSEKMASLGQLVAGVAHEINNPVSFIHGNLAHANEYVSDLLQLIDVYQQAYPAPAPAVTECASQLDTDFIRDDLPKLFTSMRVGTERIREIVSSLRTFSRLDESDAKTVNIHEGIDSTLMILQNRLKPSPGKPPIHIVKDYEALPAVECFPGQLNQVFMNLLANAIDALEERNINNPDQAKENPSQIKITTSMLKPDAVAVQIADNGGGIPQEVVEHIFNPFFTTKAVGKGTGLGLSISYQIITEKHNGKLYCHSSAAQGT